MSLCPLGDFELISDHEEYAEYEEYEKYEEYAEYEEYEKYEEYDVKITHCSGESATD